MALRTNRGGEVNFDIFTYNRKGQASECLIYRRRHRETAANILRDAYFVFMALLYGLGFAD